MRAAYLLDAMPVNAAFQSALSNDIVALYPELWFGVRFRIMDDPICFGLRQDNAHPHGAKTVRNFCSAQHMQLFPWPAYLLDVSPIEHVWYLVGRPLARDPRPAVSKDEFFLRIQVILNSLPQADIQNLFDFLPLRIAALNAARDGYTKY
ncbi:hypothetical protein TNCV_2419811 [Trichonephila clavipes]|nr:hypothetical protein TNCV_2419811 [Trichonephila clavipes]